MSAISLKSITGITSITTPTGVDNQLTLHNNNTTEAVKLDTAGNLHFHNHLNITGVSTASNFKTGTSNLHNTGLNVQDLDVDGHTNLDNVSIAGISTFTGRIDVSDNIAITSGNRLYFGNSDVAFIKGEHGASGYLSFGANNEKMRLTRTGRLGIGSDNPQKNLDIYSGQSHGSIRVHNLNNGGTGYDAELSLLGSASNSEMRINMGVNSDPDREQIKSYQSNLIFTTNTNERFRIHSNGNVSIQTNDVGFSGAGTLRINSGSTSGVLNLDGGATNHGGEINLFGGSNGGRILFRTGQGAGQQTEKMRLDENGRLIQRYSAAPYANRAATFQSPAGQGQTYVAIVNTETNGSCGILFGDHAGQNAGNYDGYINYSHQYQMMQFMVGSGNERLRIASTGQVSISSDGTTDGLLTIKGDSDQVGTPSIRLLDGSDTREVSITNTSGDFVASVHGNDNAIHGHIKMFESGQFDINNGGASGSNVNRLRINSSGQVLVGENSSPDCKLTVTNGTFMIETHTTFYSGSGENGENYPTIFFKGDHSSGNNPAHGKISVRHSAQNTYSGDLVFMPQGYYSGSYGYQEVMRVSAYKRVGINVTPASTLHVVNTTSESTIAQFGQSSGARYARFNNIPSQQNFDHLLLSRYDNTLGYQLRLQNTDAGSTGYGSAIQFIGHGGSQTGLISVVNRIANSSTARMHFNVSGDSLMHLEHAPRRVMIGEPASAGGFLSNCPNTPLQCRPSSNNTGCFAGSSRSYSTNYGLLPWSGGGTYISSGVTYNNGSWLHQSSDNSNCLFYMRGLGWYWYSSDNGSSSWNVASGGQVMNNTGVWVGGTSSDRRLKDNITNMSSSDALTKVAQLQGVSYTWKDEIQKKYGIGSYPEGTHHGFIAQDVKTVWPDAHIISDSDNESDFDDDPTKDVKDDVYYGDIEGVKLEKMVPLLVEAIKELKKENDALKTRVTTLEGS